MASKASLVYYGLPRFTKSWYLRGMLNLSRMALAAIALPALLSAQEKQRIPSVDDLLNIRSASSPQLSPDGRRVAFLVSQADWTADVFVTQVYVAPTDGGDPIQLTRGE